MSKIGFLHTSPVHVATFDNLLAKLAPEVEATHQVDVPLLDLARKNGVDDPRLQKQLVDHLTALRTAGMDTIVCTCSTLGDLAEKSAEQVGLVVKRVDRPMAAFAVANGPNILMVATVESTVDLTKNLVEDESRRQMKDVQISTLFCENAWAYFEVGDSAGYIAEIAQAIRAYLETASTPPDVILLAQASMAKAEALLADVPIPILSSPESCLRALIK